MPTASFAIGTRRVAMPAVFTIACLSTAGPALAQEANPAPPPTTSVAAMGPFAPMAPTPAPVPPADTPWLKVMPTGYVEAYYAYNVNRPSNGLTNYRGFDNRHNTFSIANVALGANWEAGPVGGRLVFQVGSTPSTYYSGEPTLAGGSGANGSSAELWKYLQEAFVTYRAPVGRGLLLQLGLCASPIGFETFAVKDSWNWSRSNLFVGFPFYHTGLRATYEWTDKLSTTISVFNGWNSVVDNNEEKSVQTNVTYKIPGKVLLQALYFGGIERTTGSVEGPYWRHHLDAVAQVDPTTWLSIAGQGDYGWEPNRVGTARWIAGALYARVKPVEHVYVALRGDRFHEHLATDAGGRSSSPIFWGGTEWVSSGTATVDVRPHEQLSVRLEYRHDVAESPLFYGRNVQGDGTAEHPYLANARTQDTLLLGGTAWF
jgi:Putative beta-barrel porin-2, OmpL-like. bbp2